MENSNITSNEHEKRMTLVEALRSLPKTWEEFIIQANEQYRKDLASGKIKLRKPGDPYELEFKMFPSGICGTIYVSRQNKIAPSASGEYLFKVFPWERFKSKD